MKALLAATLSLAHAGGLPVPRNSLAFRGATLIDGTGAAPRANALLVVSEGRIVSVSDATPESLGSLPAGTEILDVSGKWVVPGFIDAHVHADSEQDLQTMLRWGVTSARLMAEDAAAAAELSMTSRNRADIPEVFPAAPIFTTKGGWWDQGQPPDRNLDRFPAAAREAREAVRKAKALGASEVKLMLDDMAWCRAPKPAFPVVAPGVAGALLSEARDQGLRASVHAPNPADARWAIEAGATALAHGVLAPIDAKTITVMKSRPVFYIPTMDIFEFLADPRAFVDGVLSDPRAESSLPAETLARYRSKAYSDGYRERYPNFENVKSRLPALRENLRSLHAAGVPIALGTDMWAFPGLGVSIEMELFVRAGLTPSQALRAATETAARSLGIAGDRGTLEAGKRADFLLLSADPMRDVRNVRAIARTYKNGRPV